MRRRNQILLVLSVALVALFVLEPSALANTHDGEGIYGPDERPAHHGRDVHRDRASSQP